MKAGKAKIWSKSRAKRVPSNISHSLYTPKGFLQTALSFERWANVAWNRWDKEDSCRVSGPLGRSVGRGNGVGGGMRLAAGFQYGTEKM